ncbi:LCP family protein [Tuanshanicoccus lijuaniae]|uniref:LCP family glycopolymer transferase n=1 Tax=Aerococcaceae bacterium zg-1292 TaxID=2774330 RepID=UPI001936AF51|nr:LCP family protein [Aerococcaceae bacterium zg-1292]QQA36769.1 LCP family protein [Aerococcaceae bacterium zg-1292]
MKRRDLHRRPKRRGGCLKWALVVLLLLTLIIGGLGLKLFLDARNVTQSVFTEKPKTQQVVGDSSAKVSKAKPISILLLGIDTGEFGRIDQGRSDVMMVATLNPKTKQTTLVSIPRDTYTDIIGHDTKDKINHAYAFGGKAMAVNTVQSLLDIPIDYTFAIDMQGFEDIVNAVGGVNITPTSTFTQDGYTFTEGEAVKMDGAMALAYTRNRADAEGDYGRQGRQRQLLQAIVQSALSMNLITKYQEILQSLNGNISTDMPFTEMLKVVQKYGDALKTLNTIQLSGTGEMIDDVYYEMLDQTQLGEVIAELKKQLELSE